MWPTPALRTAWRPTGQVPALDGGVPSRDLTVNANIGVSGTVDGLDVSADGSKLDTHVADTSNPHGMATRLGNYVPLTGGAREREPTVNANIGVSGNASIGQQLTIGGSLIVGGTDFVLRGRGGRTGTRLDLPGRPWAC